MNLYELQAILSVLLPIAGPAIGAVYTWWATRSREAEKKVDTLRAEAFKAIEELQAHANTVDRKIGSLDQFVRSLPDRESFHELDKGLSEVRGKIDTISVSLLAQSKSLERIENFLIESARSSVRSSR